MKISIFIITTISIFFSCTTEDISGRGDFRLTISGGKAISEGFPHNQGSIEYFFVDGWEVEFKKFIIVIGEIVLSDPEDGLTEEENKNIYIVDLKKSGSEGSSIGLFKDVPAKRLDIGFTVHKATGAEENLNVDDEDFKFMVKNGLSHYIEGVAKKGTKEVIFKFSLKNSTKYNECINGTDRTKGIVVEKNKMTGAFIYEHSPFHIFWDTLASGDENLRFDAFAAVAIDGVVTEKELENQDLTDLKDEEGEPLRDKNGNRVRYNDNGMLHYDDLTLKEFVNYATRAGIHFNGVGFCNYEALD